MKITTYILIALSLFFYTISFGQTDCATSAPFCANQGAVTFPASVGNNTTSTTSTAGGPNYGCLGTVPNPAWYHFQVSQGGSINIDISGTSGGDVDFICYGPFSASTGNCANLTAGNTVDCSYSSSANETVEIVNALPGQYYSLLITNYSNQAQNINFNQTSGSGSTNCGILSSGVTSQTICAGKSAVLTANSNIINPTYVWNPSGAATVTNTVSPIVTTVYSVNISGTSPITGAPITITETSTVTVLPVPIVTPIANSPLCPGSTLNLSVNAATTYTWTGPDGFTSNLQSPSKTNITVSNVGVYTASITNTSGCIGTNTINVFLGSSVTPTLASNGPICAGQTLSLTATSGATSYTWSGPGGFNSTLQNPIITNATSSGIYTLTTAGVPCLSINTISVTIIPAIPVNIANVPVVCSNGSINLIAPSGGTDYLWSGPSNFTAAVQNPTINNADITNEGVYNVLISSGSCSSTGSVNITVNNQLNYSIPPSNLSICNGKTGNLSIGGISGGSGTYSFAWLPTTGLSNPNSATTTVTGSTSTIYTLTLSDANCPITIAITATADVVVNQSPVITMSTTNGRGCEPFCTDLISNSFPTSSNCVWKFSDGTSSVNCIQTNICFRVHGSYSASLTVTDINGCVDSVSQNNFIIVDPKPNADFEWNPGNPNIITNEVSFFDLSTVGLPMQSWNWTFGDYLVPHSMDTSSLQNPVHLYNNVGDYMATLEVFNSFGCKNEVRKLIKVEDEFAIYIPNAFTPLKPDGKNDIFIVQGIGFSADNFEMNIYDRWGALVFKTNDVTQGWDGSIKGGAKGKAGVYVYKIKVKDFRLHDKEFVGHISIL